MKRLLNPEIRTLLYCLFVVLLFLFENIHFYLVSLFLLFLLLAGLPGRVIKSGWLPITLFLFFTFSSNALNRHGEIFFSLGPLFLTLAGVKTAALKTLRVLLMIGGAKVLMGYTGIDEIIIAMGRILKPLERTGLPVGDLTHTMGLTLHCFPVLMKMIGDAYRSTSEVPGELKGFYERTRKIAAFLMPMFVRSVHCPELFFENTGIGKQHG